MDRYVLVKGKAGLGNRMMSAMTGILYAMLSSRRIVIDWSDFAYSNAGENVFPRLFSTPNSDASLPVEAGESVRPSLWKSRLHKQANEVVDEIDPKAHDHWRDYRTFSFDLKNLDYPETTLVMWSFTHLIRKMRGHFRGSFSWLSSLSDEDIMSWLLSHHLRLHPDIATLVEERWMSIPSRDNVIGVHVRFSDQKSNLGAFYRAIDKLVAATPDAGIFLATDNIKVQQDMVAAYGKVTCNDKWFPAEGQAMHQSFDCPDRTQNAIDALIDMYMLSKCKYLVFSGGSSFSYMSKLIGKMPRTSALDVDASSLTTQIRRLAKKVMA
jgi:hypothetical protein